MKTVVTGATGFIGRHLCALLRSEGHTVTAISRYPQTVRSAFGETVRGMAWDEPKAWREAVAEADAVFHLAGEPIAGQKWTPEVREKVLQSRVETTRLLADARPRVLVSASAVGFYGDRGDDRVTETDKPGDDFLAEVCVAWEKAAMPAADTGSRVVCARIGIVLGADGGPLQSMLYPGGPGSVSPWKLGLGGPLGSGRQWVPWVHIADATRLLLWSAEQAEFSGPVNVVAPQSATNAQLAHAIGAALHRPAFLTTPAFAVRALVGDFAYALLYSQRVTPARAQAAGFRFQFEEINAAMRDLLK